MLRTVKDAVALLVQNAGLARVIWGSEHGHWPTAVRKLASKQQSEGQVDCSFVLVKPRLPTQIRYAPQRGFTFSDTALCTNSHARVYSW